MFLKSTVFTGFVVAVISLAWGISGLMNTPPCPYARGCPAAPDAGTRMMVLFIGGFALAPCFILVVRRLDWPPLTGLPTGGVIGVAVALESGQTLGYWILAAVMVVTTSGIAVWLRTAIRSISVSPEPVD
ncbi:hypothetical protein ABT127_37270 [Streptomyces sp. NPDC001904]|uniref:hypothetical protein n=1 Tax=Streptomyces sp. NPDC001904 TaxID=3154531 RepID=UPI00331E0FF2